MEKKDITAQLWEMANKLRGTMDASEYKNYILPFMFYRYLSSNQDDFLQKNHLQDFYNLTDQNEISEYVDEISNNLGYALSPEFTWNTIVDKISNHKIKASDFQDLFDSFEVNVKRNADAQDDFSNIFADVNLGDTRLGSSSNERAKALFDIVLMINEFDFKDEGGKDILGDVYEYLIGQFAANAGKKGGEFYTPHQVSKILARIVTQNVKLEPGNQFRVYDPTMGSGSLLLTVQKELPNCNEPGSVEFCGQELNTTTHNLARMNLMMHGVNYKNMKLRRADTLEEDWPYDENAGVSTPMKFNAVVANPPYSQNWSANLENDPRFKAGLAPKSKADYAFIQHGIYHLENDGTMAIVLPHGVLFRGASEGKIRKVLIESNKLDTVIGLPSNLFYGTSIPTVILVFKGSEIRTSKDILFIDASADFDKQKNQNVLNDNHIDRIISVYNSRESIPKYSHLATKGEIESNDFNLNIPRYVDTFEEEEVTPLSDIITDIETTSIELKAATKQLQEMLGELVATNESDQSELHDFVSKFIEVSSNE